MYASSVSKFAVVGSLLLASAVAAAATNKAPTISGKPAPSVVVQTTYRFDAAAKDPEGAKVTFSIKNKPSWAWFDASTGMLGGEPQVAGTYSNIIISASDGSASTSLPAFGLRVNGTAAVIPALTVAGTPARTVLAGSAYAFQPTASDARVAFSIANKPSWATFSTVTGKLSGTPATRDVASFANIVITASNGKSAVSIPAFSIAVTAPPKAVTSGAATLSWTPPTANTDGSALVNLAGYRIYYGPSAESLDQVIEIGNPGVASYMVENLPAGKYYFAVRSYASNGSESALSGIGNKVIQ